MHLLCHHSWDRLDVVWCLPHGAVVLLKKLPVPIMVRLFSLFPWCLDSLLKQASGFTAAKVCDRRLKQVDYQAFDGVNS